MKIYYLQLLDPNVISFVASLQIPKFQIDVFIPLDLSARIFQTAINYRILQK